MATSLMRAVTVEGLVVWLNEYADEGRWYRMAGLAKEIGGAIIAAGRLDDLRPEARNAVEHYHAQEAA